MLFQNLASVFYRRFHAMVFQLRAPLTNSYKSYLKLTYSNSIRFTFLLRLLPKVYASNFQIKCPFRNTMWLALNNSQYKSTVPSGTAYLIFQQKPIANPRVSQAFIIPASAVNLLSAHILSPKHKT